MDWEACTFAVGVESDPESEVSLGSEAFEAPPIPRQESLSPGRLGTVREPRDVLISVCRQKMILVERYCKAGMHTDWACADSTHMAGLCPLLCFSDVHSAAGSQLSQWHH